MGATAFCGLGNDRPGRLQTSFVFAVSPAVMERWRDLTAGGPPGHGAPGGVEGLQRRTVFASDRYPLTTTVTTCSGWAVSISTPGIQRAASALMSDVIIGANGRQASTMDSTGPSQPDPLAGCLDQAQGAEETASQVVPEESFDTDGDGVPNQPPEDFDAAGCLDDRSPVLEQRVPLLDDDHSAVDELAALTASVQVLATQAERSHDRAQAREEIIARMQERITELQGDQVRALYGPIILELATLHAEVADAAIHDFAGASGEKIAAEFAFIAHRIEELLSLLGLESVAAAEGTAFDARKHLADRVIPTDDQALDRTIATVRRQGYAFPGAPRTASFAIVDVYRYDSESLKALTVQENQDEAQSPSAPDHLEVPGWSQSPITSDPLQTTPNEGTLS